MTTDCPQCGGALQISEITCGDCRLSLRGDLPTPRLYRLSAEEQHFVELFVTASGSLKQMAELLEVSYPTVRSRLNRLMERLERMRADDEVRKAQILDDIESERISAQHGMRLIDNL